MNIAAILKEEMSESIKNNLGKHKQWKKMIKRLQDLKMEIELIKKTHAEENLEIKIYFRKLNRNLRDKLLQHNTKDGREVLRH